MADEKVHLHGVPLSSEPQSVKELFAYVKALEARVEELSATLAALRKYVGSSESAE